MNTETGPETYHPSGTVVESPDSGDFAKIMAAQSSLSPARRLNLDANKTKNALAQLVLTVVKLLHELLEKQAIRRIDGGGLTDEEIEVLKSLAKQRNMDFQALLNQIATDYLTKLVEEKSHAKTGL